MRLTTLVTRLLVAAALTGIPACAEDASAPSAVTVSASSATQSGVTWKYLQAEYADLLLRSCTASELAEPDYSVCISRQNDGVRSFRIDALQLPPSRARADLLASTDDFVASYQSFVESGCNASEFDCLGFYAGMGQGFAELGRIVSREAVAE